jgi:hypothetical protein
MSPERNTREQEPKSEICANPEILLDKIRDLYEHPEDEERKATFREWLLEDWEGINEFILQFPSSEEDANEQTLVRSIDLNNYRIRRNPCLISVIRSSLHENRPSFPYFKGIDRLRINLLHQSDKTEECKKNGGKDVYMDILFVADGENRNNLLALSIMAMSKKPDQVNYCNHEYFAVRVSPELQIKKFK